MAQPPTRAELDARLTALEAIVTGHTEQIADAQENIVAASADIAALEARADIADATTTVLTAG